MKNSLFKGASLCGGVVMLLLLTTGLWTGCNRHKHVGEAGLLTFDTLYTYHNIELHPHSGGASMEVSIEYVFPNNSNKMLGVFNEKTFADKELGQVSAEKALNLYVGYLTSYYRSGIDSAEEEHLPAELLKQKFRLCNEVLYQDSLLVSVRVERMTEESGAHAMHEITLFTVDRRIGRALTEQDLFVDGYKEYLGELIVKSLQSQYRTDNPEDLEPEGFFSASEIFPNGNFYLDETGITYCFNEYEIATYATGVVFVHIDYNRLVSILSRESLIRRLLPR